MNNAKVEQKFTPGPWVHAPYEVRGYLILKDNLPLAHVKMSSYMLIGEDKANARLIAAAPEMLEALNRIATRGRGILKKIAVEAIQKATQP